MLWDSEFSLRPIFFFFLVHLLQSECKTVAAEIDNNLVQIPLRIPSSILFHVGFANNSQQRNGRAAQPGYLSRLQAKRAQAAQMLAVSWDEMEYFWKNVFFFFLLKSIIFHLKFHLSLMLEWWTFTPKPAGNTARRVVTVQLQVLKCRTRENILTEQA